MSTEVIHTLICEYCRNEFQSARRKRFCTARCRAHADYAKRKIVHHLQCIRCKKEFATDHKKKYCTAKCRQDDEHERRAVEITCIGCGGHAMVSSSRTKYCSVDCANRRPIIVYWKLCKFCGNQFPSNPSNKGQWLEVVKDAAVDKDAEFCSVECSVYARAFRTPEHRWLVQQMPDAERMLRQMRVPKLVANGCVSHAGIERIRKQVHEWLKRSNRVCPACGQRCAFYKSFCSDCKKKRLRDTKQKNHRQRCRKYGAAYQAGVTLAAVTKRDGGLCHWCNCKTVAWDGRERNRYATLDHVIPLSGGGSHTMDNVVVACNQCNAMKGVKRKTLF